MNILLWIVQVILGGMFVVHGFFILPPPPPELPPTAQWLRDLSPTFRIFIGVAEILGGLGLILPGLTRIRPELTPLAAVGLGLIMVSAIVFHVLRGEPIVTNIVLLAVAAFVAYGRARLAPLRARTLSRARLGEVR
jgi:putative oxidoreductase